MSGQLCKVAEGLSYNDITLAHRHPPPSPQNSDTCANPVQNLGAPRLSIDILDSYIFVPSGNLAWSRPVQISTSKIASLRSMRFSAVHPCFPLLLSHNLPLPPRSLVRFPRVH